MQIFLFTALSIFLLFSCSSQNREVKSTSVLLGDHYVALTFDPSETTLSYVNKVKLKRFLQHSFSHAAEKIRLLVWSDEEYNPKGVSEKNVSIAQERAWNIKDFIHQQWPKMEKVIVFNMAQGPHPLERTFRTEQFRVKSTFQMSGLTATTLPDGRISYTKASKAMVIMTEDEKL